MIWNVQGTDRNITLTEHYTSYCKIIRNFNSDENGQTPHIVTSRAAISQLKIRCRVEYEDYIMYIEVSAGESSFLGKTPDN